MERRSRSIQLKQLPVLLGELFAADGGGQGPRFSRSADRIFEPARFGISSSQSAKEQRFLPVGKEAGALGHFHSGGAIAVTGIRMGGP